MAAQSLNSSLLVVLLGPDGCGKSSVVSDLEQSLSDRFGEIEVHHLRPRKGRAGSRGRIVVENPHEQPPRSRLQSMAKLFYLLWDYSAIYRWKRRMKRQDSPKLIIFDRYYHDLLVDPVRYRYSGPMWLARWVGNLIPRPDLWILLDAPADVIHSRKSEVTFEETQRQRQAYLDLVARLENGCVVDAAQPLEKVASTVRTLIAGHGA